jgi:hypothetical protein
MKSNWSAWEYRALSENCAIEETARLLGRGVEEVSQKISTVCEGTFEGWYGRRRKGVSTDTPRSQWGQTCHGAPECPKEMVRLAQKICREDFKQLRLLDEEVQHQARKAVDHALRYFNPNVGDQSVPVQRRFLRLFRNQLLKQLWKESRRRMTEEWAYPHTDELATFPRVVTTVASGDEEWRLWAQRLLSEALKRVGHRARKVIEMRLRGKPDKAIARQLADPDR